MALTKIPGNLIETGAITGDVLADGGIATAKLADAAVTTDKILDTNITHAKLHTSMDLTGKTVTVATAAGSTNTTAAASTAFVQQELTTLIGGAPGTLDTLNELAAAINDDSNYNTTLTTALATKLPLAGGTMSGGLNMGSQNISAINNATAVSFLSTNGYWVGGTQRMNGGGNLLNIGTISSGAITSTGSSTFGPSTFTSTSVMDINLVANPPELNFEDTSGTSGSKRARWTLDSGLFSAQGLSDDDQSLSYSFIEFNLSNGSITTPKGGAHNVHLGENALLYSVGSSANYNTAIGKDALRANTSGSNGVAIGFEALMSDQTVEESTAVGAMALRSQTSGRNHAFGFRALMDLQGGVYNTAVGGETLENVINGGYNTAVGAFAGRLNQNGDQNTYIGYQSGYTNNGGDGNVALGHKAFYGSTSANNCIAIGRDSMGSAVTGDFNISIGRTSSNSMTSGTQNTSIGVDSLTSINTGSYNVAIGPSALRLGTGAMSNNTAIGVQSGRNTTSNNNVFVGYESGYYNTTGTFNTYVGTHSGEAMSTGSNNVIIGKYSGNNQGLDMRTMNNNVMLSDGDGNIVHHQGNQTVGASGWYDNKFEGWYAGARGLADFWIFTTSNFSNPVTNLITHSGGALYATLMVRVEVHQKSWANAAGNIHAATVLCAVNVGVGQLYATTSTMVVLPGSSGQMTSVGSLAWSGSNGDSSRTLQYTPNRVSNYDSYDIHVTATWRGGGAAYSNVVCHCY